MNSTNSKPTNPNTTPNPKQPIAAVTGASGFIGSHLCQNLLEHGYLVRACVRKHIPSKVDHLLGLASSERVNQAGGKLELCVADMSIPGAYDEIFGNGCEYVFHVAGNFGTDYHLWRSKADNAVTSAVISPVSSSANYEKGRPPPIQSLWKKIRGQEDSQPQDKNYHSYDHAVYESYVVAMEYILMSIAKHQDTIRRIIYTSSGAAGGTISLDLADDEAILENAYGQAKHDCEALLYEFCKNSKRFIGVSVCPCIVLGPMMGTPPLHDSVYPHRLSDMLRGRYTLRQHWEIADVRDVAETHRLAAEAPNLINGTRFWIGNEPSWWISSMLEYLTSHEKFANETRLSPLFVSEDESSESNGSSSSESESESERDDQKGNDNDNENDNDQSNNNNLLSMNNDNEEHDDQNSDRGSENSLSSSSSSSSSSRSSDDSYGVSEWDKHDSTTTWSDPKSFFANVGYTARTPQQTVLDTTINILERWDALGRDLTIQECSDYYTVAEMDGCYLEMKWLEKEIRRKSIEVEH